MIGIETHIEELRSKEDWYTRISNRCHLKTGHQPNGIWCNSINKEEIKALAGYTKLPIYVRKYILPNMVRFGWTSMDDLERDKLHHEKETA